MHDLPDSQYSVNQNIRFKTIVTSGLYDQVYSDVYVVVNLENNSDKIRSYILRMLLHLDHAYQKSITHS